MMSLKEAMEYVIRSHIFFTGYTLGDHNEELMYHQVQIIRIQFEYDNTILLRDIRLIISMIFDILEYERDPDMHDGLISLKSVLEYCIEHSVKTGTDSESITL